jgi:predicted Zn-dependent protease
LKDKRVVYVFVLGLFFFGCATVYNPATGKKEFIAISTQEEIAMGKDFHSRLTKEYTLSKDLQKAVRLNKVGLRLAAVSDRKDYEYNFYLVEKDEVNAFTTPGGNIYMFTGLMDKLDSDDALAGVLAHEIGHCAAKHTVKKFQAVLGYNLLAMIALTQIGDDDTRKTTAIGTGVLMTAVFAAYSRGDEYEADHLAIRYMGRAGYDPEALLDVFAVLKEESQKGVSLPIFRTHPHIDERIAKVREEIQAPVKKQTE